MNPRPPNVGDVFSGPEIGHGVPTRTGTPGKYYVRAVVDVEGEDPTYGWIYHVVLRCYTRHKGWRYAVVDSFAFGAGLYKPLSKRLARLTATV